MLWNKGWISISVHLRVRAENPCDKSAYCHEYRNLIVDWTYFQHPNYDYTSKRFTVIVNRVRKTDLLKKLNFTLQPP